MNKRIFLSWIALAGCMAAGASAWAADPYPASKVIRVVVPFSAGSGSDGVARNLVNRVATATGWQFVVENKAGASGIVAVQEVKRSPADGYTLFYTGNTTHGANSALFKSLPYDPVADFDPITRVGVFPLALLTRPDLGAADVAGVVKMAKAQGNSLTFAAASAGPRVAAENFKHQANIDLRYIPYKSSPQAMTDLIGGQVDTMFLDLVASLPMIRAGKLKALAVTSTQRFAGLANVPTMVESGFPDFEVLNWSGVFVLQGTPQSVRDTLYRAFADVVASDAWKRYVADLGGYADTLTPEQTTNWVKREIRGYREALARAGVVPE